MENEWWSEQTKLLPVVVVGFWFQHWPPWAEPWHLHFYQKARGASACKLSVVCRKKPAGTFLKVTPTCFLWLQMCVFPIRVRMAECALLIRTVTLAHVQVESVASTAKSRVCQSDSVGWSVLFVFFHLIWPKLTTYVQWEPQICINKIPVAYVHYLWYK